MNKPASFGRLWRSADFPVCGFAELSSSAWGLESPHNPQTGKSALRASQLRDAQDRSFATGLRVSFPSPSPERQRTPAQAGGGKKRVADGRSDRDDGRLARAGAWQIFAVEQDDLD